MSTSVRHPSNRMVIYSELVRSVKQKQCTLCKEIKTTDDFYSHISSKSGLQSNCKKCMKKQSARYQRPNSDAVRGFKSSEIRKKIQARYREKNREKIRAIQRKYVKQNPVKVLIKTRRYQCNKMQRTPSWLTKDHWAKMDSFYIKADSMRKKGFIVEVDHILPLQGENVSGLHVPWNLQIIERFKNRAKHNRMND